jgi:hypothetical protein
VKSLAAPAPAAGVETARAIAVADHSIVTLATNDVIDRGERKNEDAFSIQTSIRATAAGVPEIGDQNIARDVRTPPAAADPLPGASYATSSRRLKNPSRWITYSGDQRTPHSPFPDEYPAECRAIVPVDISNRDDDACRGFEATPLCGTACFT